MSSVDPRYVIRRIFNADLRYYSVSVTLKVNENCVKPR